MAFGIVVLAGGERADDLMGLPLVEVKEQISTPTTYYLRYPVYVQDGDLAPLKEPRLGAGADLAVFQRATGFNDCLVKGQVFSHQVNLGDGVEGSVLEVVGADATIRMDRETRRIQWATNTSDSDAVTSILDTYGLTPDVQTTDTRHLEEKRTLVQHDTDLGFVRMLARRNGYLFWVSCDADLRETAHFTPPVLDVPDAPVLKYNLDNPTLKGFSIVWDVERPTSVIANAYDGAAKNTLDAAGVPPPATFAEDTPLSAIISETRSSSVVAAVADVGDLMGRANGLLMDSSWFIQATGTVSAQQLGAVIHAHSVVKVDGVGTRYSGSYFVAAVHHVINESDHLMKLTLLRNGWRT